MSARAWRGLPACCRCAILEDHRETTLCCCCRRRSLSGFRFCRLSFFWLCNMARHWSPASSFLFHLFFLFSLCGSNADRAPLPEAPTRSAPKKRDENTQGKSPQKFFFSRFAAIDWPRLFFLRGGLSMLTTADGTDLALPRLLNFFVGLRDAQRSLRKIAIGRSFLFVFKKKERKSRKKKRVGSACPPVASQRRSRESAFLVAGLDDLVASRKERAYLHCCFDSWPPAALGWAARRTRTP